MFNHEQGALHQDVTLFADPAEALRAYNATERLFAEQAHVEVVLIGSDSLNTVRRTHANDFDGGARLRQHASRPPTDERQPQTGEPP